MKGPNLLNEQNVTLAIQKLLVHPSSTKDSLYEGIREEYKKPVAAQRLLALQNLVCEPAFANAMQTRRFYEYVSDAPSLSWVIPTMTKDPVLKKLIPYKAFYEFFKSHPALQKEANLSDFEKVHITLLIQNPEHTGIQESNPAREGYDENPEIDYSER